MCGRRSGGRRKRRPFCEGWMELERALGGEVKTRRDGRCTALAVAEERSFSGQCRLSVSALP